MKVLLVSGLILFWWGGYELLRSWRAKLFLEQLDDGERVIFYPTGKGSRALTKLRRRLRRSGLTKVIIAHRGTLLVRGERLRPIMDIAYAYDWGASFFPVEQKERRIEMSRLRIAALVLGLAAGGCALSGVSLDLCWVLGIASVVVALIDVIRGQLPRVRPAGRR